MQKIENKLFQGLTNTELYSIITRICNGFIYNPTNTSIIIVYKSSIIQQHNEEWIQSYVSSIAGNNLVFDNIYGSFCDLHEFKRDEVICIALDTDDFLNWLKKPGESKRSEILIFQNLDDLVAVKEREKIVDDDEDENDQLFDSDEDTEHEDENDQLFDGDEDTEHEDENDQLSDGDEDKGHEDENDQLSLTFENEALRKQLATLTAKYEREKTERKKERDSCKRALDIQRIYMKKK